MASVRALVTVPSRYSRRGGRRCPAVREDEEHDRGDGLGQRLGWAGNEGKEGRTELGQEGEGCGQAAQLGFGLGCARLLLPEKKNKDHS